MANKGHISLAEKFPEIALEWHPTKNGDLKPTDVSYGSSRKILWRGECGHEWIATCNHRTQGTGCSVCAEIKKVNTHKINWLKKYGSLADNNPELAKQWHPTKNGKLTANDVTVNSDIKVWWMCPKGHEYLAGICHRNAGTGCPICCGKKVLVGYNDLATLRPDIALEWNASRNGTLTAENITLGSDKKVWWKCYKGHEWQTSVAHRVKGRRCPICFGESKTSFPEQAIFYYFSQVTTAYNRYMLDARTEIDIYLPEYMIGIEYDGAYFHKGKRSEEKEQKKEERLRENGVYLFRVKEKELLQDNKIESSIIYTKSYYNDVDLTTTINNLIDCINIRKNLSLKIDVNIARDRSKIYEQYIISDKERSLSSLKPDFASQWHPTKNGKLLPEHVAANSNKKVWWQCDKGHEWQATVNGRGKGIGCPYCAGLKVIVGENDLATVNPDLALQWHPTKNGDLKPSDFLPNSNKKVWWQCEFGHEWCISVSHRNRGRGCPICSGHKVLAGYNDLATLKPDLATEWHPTKNGALMPNSVVCGSDKKVWWLCNEEHEWEASISSRVSGHGCPYCAGQAVIKGVNDLATLHPNLAKEWHPTKNGERRPSDVMSKCNDKAWWIGECGHEWEAVIASRSTGRGCPYCASQKLLVGFNDLATLNPKLASEWHPIKNGELTPKDVMSGSNRKVWWRCEKGHEWQNTISVRNSGHNCPYCAGQMNITGVNDLATLKPELALEWHPTKNGDTKPSDVMPGCNHKAWWLGKCGHEWESVIASRSKGIGCPYCANKKTLAGYNDLATLNPKLVAEWHPTKNGELTPYQLTPGSNKKVWWQCDKGHEWEATPNKRKQGRDCPYCKPKKK